MVVDFTNCDLCNHCDVDETMISGWIVYKDIELNIELCKSCSDKLDVSVYDDDDLNDETVEFTSKEIDLLLDGEKIIKFSTLDDELKIEITKSINYTINRYKKFLKIIEKR